MKVPASKKVHFSLKSALVLKKVHFFMKKCTFQFNEDCTKYSDQARPSVPLSFLKHKEATAQTPDKSKLFLTLPDRPRLGNQKSALFCKKVHFFMKRCTFSKKCTFPG